MNKRLLRLAVVVVLLLSGLVAACQPPAPAPVQAPAPPPAKEEVQEISIGLATTFPDAHIMARVARKFKELAEAKSKGAIEVDLFMAGALGSEEAIMKQVSVGAIEGQTGGGLIITAHAPSFAFMVSPFVMEDWNHVQAVMDSDLGAQLRAQIEAAGGTTVVEPVPLGFRHFTSNKPIVTPEDLKGIKLRLPMIPSWVAIWTEIGAYPVPVSLPELYTALATGIADASEGELTQIYGFKLNEVQSHLSLTGHLIAPGFISFNTEWLNGLNKETRSLVMEAAKEASEWGNKEMMRDEEELLAKLEAKGMTVVNADGEAFFQKGMPAVEELFRTEWTVTTLEEVRAFAR